ncbi:hypothetical protein QO034_19725 [Sedimentitalea sp. JM2-8]|uniref:Uncharacterized protein n=1 Tax=Sedimentitalea xiamensis TaxID=3050037 RepID=A0ABT7FJQ9_9RHOB|nr:hypothetical protein [Sedimentitalea xiamensis]MDK3075313.1 hypothetical protein [Sedimentitalea xiamensis]
MVDGAVTHDDLIAGLHGLRLPETAAGGTVADVVVAVALGLILALVVAALLSPVLARETRPDRVPDLEDRLRDLRDLPDEDRAVRLLHLLAALDPDSAAELRGRIYRAGAFPESAELEDRLRRHA